MIGEILGYLGLSLLAVSTALHLPGVCRLSVIGRCGIALLWLGLNLIPVYQGSCFLFYLRGLLGDLGLASQTILFLTILNRLGVHSPYTAGCPRDVAFIVASILTLLYLCTLGHIHYDLYVWGYRPQGMLLALAIMMAYAWIRHPALAIAWLVGAIGFALELPNSINLWDSLSDPLLYFGCLWRIVFSGKNRSVAS